MPETDTESAVAKTVDALLANQPDDEQKARFLALVADADNKRRAERQARIAARKKGKQDVAVTKSNVESLWSPAVALKAIKRACQDGYRPVTVMPHNLKDENAGKRPAIFDRGSWRGSREWEEQALSATLDDLTDWHGQTNSAPNVGILCGAKTDRGYLVAVDIDCEAPALVDAIAALAGDIAIRKGRPGRSGLIPVIVDNLGEHEVFKRGDDAVQLLRTGKQFVAIGIHPGTRQPYHWIDRALDSPVDMPALDGLPVVKMRDLVRVLGDCGFQSSGTSLTSKPVNDSDPEFQRLIEELDGEREDHDVLFGDDGKFPLSFIRKCRPDFADAYDNPGSDHSANRMKTVTFLVGAYPALTVSDYAVFKEHWNGAGEYDNRQTVREYMKGKRNPASVSEQSDGRAFDAVDDAVDESNLDRPTKRNELKEYEAALKKLAPKTKDAGQPASSLRSALDHIREFAPQDELVEGLWPVRGLCSIYGDSNSGKTFFAFAAGKAVAKGTPFNGGDTQKAGVLYFGSEGREGTDARMTALYAPIGDAEAKATGLDPEDFVTRDAADTIHTSFDFPFDAKNSREACARFHRIACEFKELRGEFPGLMVVDHLVAMLPHGANLNDPVEMQNACAELRKLQQVLGCLIVVIGHVNKTDGYLGSVMQRAAWDRSLKIEKSGGSGEAAVHSIHDDKIRDGLAGGSSNTFRLVTRKIGTTPRGKDVTSAVVSFDTSFAFPEVDDVEERILSGAACDTLEEFIVEHMRREAEGSERPPVFTSVELREAIAPALDYFAPKGRAKVKDGAKLAEQRRKQFARAVAALEKSGRLSVEPTNGVQSILRLVEQHGATRGRR
jgi:hypothetical protein